MWVLGASPKAVEALVKILLAVPSCTWVSRPITASQGACWDGTGDAGATAAPAMACINAYADPMGRREGARWADSDLRWLAKLKLSPEVFCSHGLPAIPH